MLDMGFRPQVDRILGASADEPADHALLRHARRRRRRAGARVYVERVTLPRRTAQRSPPGTIEHTFVAVTPEGKLDRLVEQLKTRARLALVFVRTKHGADKLVRKLASEDVAAVAMHGNMSQNQRERALARFESGRSPRSSPRTSRRAGSTSTTSRHVINFDPPTRRRLRAPRRPHRPGRSYRHRVTFVLPDQQHDVGRLAERLGHGAAFSAAGLTGPQAKRPPNRQQRRRRGRRPLQRA